MAPQNPTHGDTRGPADRDSRRPAPRPGDTANRILVVAVELFASRGYAGTSIRDITDRLEITKSALYYHFSSKEEILAALISPFREDLRALLDAADAGELTPAGMLECLVEIVSRRGAVIQALLGDPSVVSHAHQSNPREDFRRLASALATGAGVSVLRARSALGAVNAGVFFGAERPSHLDPDRAQQLVEGSANILDPSERAEVVAAAVGALGLDQRDEG
jgi:AcrR family transcriptional regulator